MKKLSLFILLLSFTGLYAQNGPEGILFSNLQDANTLTQAYMNPAMKGLIYGMNNSWYHTAKVHKKFGFDISIAVNASMVPSKDEMFSVTNLNSITQPGRPPGHLTSATVAGSENDGSLATVTFQENGITYTGTFNMPGGIKESLPLNAIPSPTIQASLGLPWQFEASLRFVPKVGSEDVKGDLFGFGLKKEITDWFGPLGKTPLHVSLLAAYTNMNVNYQINDDDPNDNIAISPDSAAKLRLNSYTFQALASLNFPVFNIYGGVGYNSGNSTLKMLGTYTISYNASINQRTITDPLNLNFDAGGFNATIGARLSLGFFKLFGSYTVQEYNTLNAGIAFSFR
ncbi:DUF6588 family protein [Tenacibaculum sp. TC6]|uniref:DUF6588 family protein n=1 Tax=Tenacibaculum sp. TC6 TaxID=3423223 RepID=UPI003D361BEE